MIIVKTPFRVSFFGGGTDYPDWYNNHGGQVISAAIDKYSYVLVRRLPPFFPFRNRVRYFSEENTESIDSISHPIVRESAKLLGVQEGFELVHTADLPARSGLGSSSAFAVGTLQAFLTLLGQKWTKEELAKLAIHLEQVILRETVGSQDQIAAAYGGLNSIHFHAQEFDVQPLSMHPDIESQLAETSILCFTGFTRTASEVASQQIRRIRANEQLLFEIVQLAEAALKLLSRDNVDFEALGSLLNEQWKVKRSLGPGVSNLEIDNIYDTAIRNGAWGGKLLGAGGGGFMLFLAPRESHVKIQQALPKNLFVPFGFDTQGSTVVYQS